MDDSCDICDNKWCNNLLIKCSSPWCSIVVHEECYGYIENSDQWRCKQCENGGDRPCAICGLVSQCPMKPTTEGHFAHIVCALYTPETDLSDDPLLKSIENVPWIDSERIGLRCSICKEKDGSCIRCAFEGCNVPMHVICGQGAGRLMAVPGNPFGAFCKRHLRQAHEIVNEDCEEVLVPTLFQRSWYIDSNNNNNNNDDDNCNNDSTETSQDDDDDDDSNNCNRHEHQRDCGDSEGFMKGCAGDEKDRHNDEHMQFFATEDDVLNDSELPLLF